MERPLFAIFLLFFFSYPIHAQYYLRGELKNEEGQGLQGARINLFSKGTYPYYTGSSGAFGIPVTVKVDTVTLILEGYDTLKQAVITSQYQNLVLRPNRRKILKQTTYLSSVTTNYQPSMNDVVTIEGESYSSTLENTFVNTTEYPETGLSLNNDKASYSNIRRFLNSRERPPADAVRIEEMLNYFNLKGEAPVDENKDFTFGSQITSCPWNADHRLLFLRLKARKINLEKTLPANLVFLIDVSGSMDMPNRLPLIKSAFKLLTENLRSNDLVSIVTYGDRVSLLLAPTSGSEKKKIIEAIEGLIPAGTTPGASAIKTAFSVAKSSFMPNGNNRVILATDGDFNIGQTSEKDLEEIITQERKSGIYLTCLGVGMGNYKDSKLETLAKNGNGNFAYLDNEREAEKVLVEEFAQTVYNVANDVHLTVRFNSELIKDYRLIGYDNKKSAIAEKVTQVEGGEIGSGNALIAAFEFTPVAAQQGTAPVARVLLNYTTPSKNIPVKETYDVGQNFKTITECDRSLRFASSIILFGTMLKQSQYSGTAGWDELHSLALSSADPNSLLELELIDLINKAKKIYGSNRKKLKQ